MKGLYEKYKVERTDGKPTGKCFVLEYEKDQHAKNAIIAYAISIIEFNPILARDLLIEVL